MSLSAASFSPPMFDGPFDVSLNYLGLNVTDFTFTCTIQYLGDDDGTMFDVVLTFDGVPDESTLKTTTSSGKTVVFNSTDLQGHFGTKVSKIFYLHLMSSSLLLLPLSSSFRHHSHLYITSSCESEQGHCAHGD